MRNHFPATHLICLLATLATPAIAYAAEPIEIGQTSSNITAQGGCDFWKPGAPGPKIAKVKYNGIDFLEYQHEPGGPILLEGQEGADKHYKRIAALHIDGKERLLEMTKVESVQCSDETHAKPSPCESHEYADQTIRVKVKQLSNLSMCIGSGREEAACGRIISALVNIESAAAQTSFVVVGRCTGD